MVEADEEEEGDDDDDDDDDDVDGDDDCCFSARAATRGLAFLVRLVLHSGHEADPRLAS